MDYPTYPSCCDEDYITKTPGLMPDILIPLSSGNNIITAGPYPTAVWAELNIPKGFKGGKYEISLKFTLADAASLKMENSDFKEYSFIKTMTVNILDKSLSEQKIRFTQWMYSDCIAKTHNVEIFSEAHWYLIEQYIKKAAHLGINMMLTPIHTPPLDTSRGTVRPCVQLVDISKIGDEFSFSFDKLDRWIDICRRNGIKYYEAAHIFSQWGSEFSANIKVNGEYMFGWHTRSDSEEYIGFLKQYIPALVKHFEEIGIAENTYFHISDEPCANNEKQYRKAHDIIKPLLGNCKLIEALSDYEFYEKGLVECPVTATNHLNEFLKHDIPEQWAYYCCGQYEKVGNRFLSQPSYRNRILGFQLYKFGIKGFLHWGFNFYYSRYSVNKINPYITTSADLGFPSGDAFTVYPGQNDVFYSLRGFVFYDALQDIRLCEMLERYIGREKTVEIIEQEAQMEITFENYPRNDRFIINARNRIISELEKFI